MPPLGNGHARGERRPQARKATGGARGASIDGTIIAGASVVGAIAMVIIASSRLWPRSPEVKKEVCPGIPQWETVGSNAREAAVPALVAVLRLRDTCNMQDCCWFVDRTSTLHERAIHVCIARCECAAVCDPPND